ncbi:MAG: substrate-binding domain-containing protein [Campylobacterales bacterium]
MRLGALLVVLALVVEGAQNFKVGVLYWSMNIPGQVAMRQGLEAEAKKINKEAAVKGKRGVELFTYVAGDGIEGMERQIGQMYEAIRQKPDILIVQPTDNAALAKPLLEANRLGIPVVAYDQYISQGKLASFLTSDNYMAGWLDGEYIASLYPDSKTILVALVEYPHVSGPVDRVEGFLDALKRAGQPYKVVKSYKAVEPKSGRIAGRKIVADFPMKGSLDVVFCINDGGGISVAKELEKAGRNEIKVATVDGDPESVAMIRAGRQIVIDSAQFCGPLGAAALRTAYKILNNEKVPKQQLIPVFPVTKETLSRYPGWLGPIPDAFDKPWKSTQPRWDNQLRSVDTNQ